MHAQRLTRIRRFSAPVRLGFFIFLLLCLWLPVALPVYLLVADANWASILALSFLYGEFLWLVRWWERQVYQQPYPLVGFGLTNFTKYGMEMGLGVAIAFGSLFALYSLQASWGWLVWQPLRAGFGQILVEGLLVAVGIGFAEELFFRGWLLAELQRDYFPRLAWFLNAGIFALLHYLKPLQQILQTLPEFAGLFLLGITLILAKRATGGRLWLPIGLHAGFVWGYYAINVGHLVQFSQTVPPWLTGIHGNPLAGVVGLLFLGAIAVIFTKLNLT
ncbi:type II CAAX endopeptidase family protein [Geitlerinema sp. PCC 9228]|uniref:CPBP family intramembrane glutamic endopeptidase n=1 Tax=Geitlerinema sp. PCC 9228 TaxID=111611 RepID=UPI0008F9B6B8|nr:type II CAAX endopeptidase family protein [Geitlerinema sp. PCC 9228]